MKKILGMGFLRSHARRLFTEFLDLSFNYDWLFRLIGKANGRLGIISSVFLAYPANDEYSDAYTYRSRAMAMDWNPGPVGFFWLNGRLSVKFTVSNRNEDYLDPANKEKLRELVARMEKIRMLFRAKHKTFAGIIPGVVFMRRLVRETPEADVTAEVVKQAIEKIRRSEGLDSTTPIIVLGGRGFIGRKVVALLPRELVCSVDIAGGNGEDQWPAHLRGKPAILVNISNGTALRDYVDLMWPGVVVVNEVYPEPSGELAERIKKTGCHCYHIVGVKARALPVFPGAYEGGIPCCAAWGSENIVALYRRIV